MRPQLASLAKKHGDKVVVLKVDVDRQRMLASMAGVRSIPDRRLFIGGRQVERSVGGMSRKALEQLVLKHGDKLGPSRGMVAKQVPPRSLERQLPEVSDDQRLPWPQGKPAADVAAAESAARGKPAGAVDAKKDAGLKSGTIEPMAKDWLPPGVTKVK